MAVEDNIVKKGQIWQHKVSKKQFLIVTKKGMRWRAHELTNKPGFYASTHSFLPFILRQKFDLIS